MMRTSEGSLKRGLAVTAPSGGGRCLRGMEVGGPRNAERRPLCEELIRPGLQILATFGEMRNEPTRTDGIRSEMLRSTTGLGPQEFP